MASDLPTTCVFGLGWGDEGKGKIVDLLCPGFDVVVRFNGGANAGHTVCVGDDSFALHLLPSGVLHENTINVIGPGVVVDPTQLIREIETFQQRGFDVTANLKISDRAHVVMPYHQLEDRLVELAAGAGKIGTTARGIGPCYADKMRRSTAVRLADLANEDDMTARVKDLVLNRNLYLKSVYPDAETLDPEKVVKDLAAVRIKLLPMVCDTTSLLHESVADGKSLLFEGANGMLLDVDHGTYPFVTSSSTGPHGIGSGAGVPATRVTHRIGVTKAYATRVGSGPFVSELTDQTGARIREQGHEFGTTTGRPRRCGWFDAVANRYTARLSGATGIALMHLDTLSGFKEIGICTSYRLNGETLSHPPARSDDLEKAEAVVEFQPGWDENLRQVRNFQELPANTRRYVERIESLMDVEVTIIGVGPERSQTVLRGEMERYVDVLRPANV